jgi:hypothetical protein
MDGALLALEEFGVKASVSHDPEPNAGDGLAEQPLHRGEGAVRQSVVERNLRRGGVLDGKCQNRLREDEAGAQITLHCSMP